MKYVETAQGPQDLQQTGNSKLTDASWAVKQTHPDITRQQVTKCDNKRTAEEIWNYEKSKLRYIHAPVHAGKRANGSEQQNYTL